MKGAVILVFCCSQESSGLCSIHVHTCMKRISTAQNEELCIFGGYFCRFLLMYVLCLAESKKYKLDIFWCEGNSNFKGSFAMDE